MINDLEKSECCGCYSCVEACPQQAILMECDGEGFWYPNIDKNKCIDCNICDQKCPSKNASIRESKKKAYACLNRNEDVRLRSSSGGIFSVIAEHILNQKGVVFGACFDENFNLRHDFVDNIIDLDKLRGSKYVQSKIGKSYKMTKKFLEEERLVLFVGTPCQIEGLRFYLSKDYKNLICCDFICHGVSSPKIWNKFILEKQQKYNSKVKNVSFRDKNRGWKQYSMILKFENNHVYNKDLNKDTMLRAYLSNICLRPSCYRCKYKTVDRASDLTFADFWRVDDVYPNINDDKGISLLLINSEKGQNIFDNISDKIISEKVDFINQVSNIETLTTSVKENNNRSKFFKEVDDNNLEFVINKYCKIKVMNIIRFLIPRKIKLVIKNMKNKF